MVGLLRSTTESAVAFASTPRSSLTPSHPVTSHRPPESRTNPIKPTATPIFAAPATLRPQMTRKNAINQTHRCRPLSSVLSPPRTAVTISSSFRWGENVLAKIHSFILLGIDAHPCEIEVDVANRGLQKTIIVGLAQTAVKESIERVRRAVINSGYAYPGHHLLINLAPADVKKEGPALDLPMAIGVLRGTNFIQNDRHKEFLIAAELGPSSSRGWMKSSWSV